ncbi:MAG: type 4a pilus biogenesis protein PilO [Candidatus Daviesbacteria bacterium]|nr:MAG: type 4a pilus biogenesis protein PilO [Candidatus Daviesbacteria bacterium]
MNNQHRYSRYFTYIAPILRAPIVKTYGSLILSIVVVAIFILFAIKPTIGTILVLQKNLENSKQVLAQIIQKSKDLSEARKNYQSLDPAIRQKIDTTIPPVPNLKTVIAALEQNALSNQASISALQIDPISIPNATESAKNLTEIQFTFTLEGSYNNLLNTLNGIKNSSRLISVTGLTLNKNPESSSILMQIVGKAFFLK